MNVQDPSLPEALARGRTLPAEWYTDPKLFEREQERIFAAIWNYVGRIEQVENAGDFLTGRVGQVPVVIVRDEAGTLRAYANVCRHRGSELVLEKSRQPPHTPVPLSRLDLGSRRNPAQLLTARSRLDSTRPTSRSHPSELRRSAPSSSSTPAPHRAHLRPRSASCPQSSGQAAPTLTHSSFASGGNMRSRPTGRSWSRISLSATIARSPIRASPI